MNTIDRKTKIFNYLSKVTECYNRIEFTPLNNQGEFIADCYNENSIIPVACFSVWFNYGMSFTDKYWNYKFNTL